MTRILFTSWYTGLGGGETDLLTLVDALDKSRYEPHLLLPAEGPLSERWRGAGLPLHILPYRGASTFFIPAIWERFPIISRMTELLRHEQIRLVKSDYHTLPLIAPAAQSRRIPLTWTLHGWWFKPKPWQKGFFRRIPTATAISKAARDSFLGDPPFMPGRQMPVIYAGVDTERFRPALEGLALRREIGISAEAPLVAMVARFQPVKGHHRFQALARRVLAEKPDAHFIVAGDDVFGVSADERYRERIMASARSDAVLRDRLHYLGFRADVEAVYAAADVFVCPSDFESYGLANLEAMACAVPVVSTGRGGPAETIVDGLTGYLVDPDDSQALATAVMRLLADEEGRKRMGDAGRYHIERNFSAAAGAAAHRKIFDELLELN